jgi:hypothetical protein
MENEWITSDTGTRTFHHTGWELAVFAHCPHQITVTAPNSEVDVEVTPDGIECFGESSSGYSFSGIRFTIPWRILAEISAFHAVQSSSSK